MSKSSVSLTVNGRHECPCWDGMLVGPQDDEWSGCQCVWPRDHEIASLRARLERAREEVSMSKDSFTKIMEATKSGGHGDQIIARHCEAMLCELESDGGER